VCGLGVGDRTGLNPRKTSTVYFPLTIKAQPGAGRRGGKVRGVELPR
jgi:hypothetical protein